jgi:hypothetical protein
VKRPSWTTKSPLMRPCEGKIYADQVMQPTAPRRYVYMSILIWNTQFVATCASPKPRLILSSLDVETARLIVQVVALMGVTFATSGISPRS